MGCAESSIIIPDIVPETSSPVLEPQTNLLPQASNLLHLKPSSPTSTNHASTEENQKDPKDLPRKQSQINCIDSFKSVNIKGDEGRISVGGYMQGQGRGGSIQMSDSFK